jgi:hypothetical protein
MFPQLVPDFIRLRDDFMGSKEAMTDHPGMTNNAGKSYYAPTYFETLGQNSVKANRCYSASMTHQHPRSLVGPTAGGKVYEDVEMDENTELRKRVLEVCNLFLKSEKQCVDKPKAECGGSYDRIEGIPSKIRPRTPRRQFPSQQSSPYRF